ncbi:hypothetical protein [Arsenicicoccus sp. oral taxon 190]|uniref:hypothetical protein n=1 Tax=Arsenicicoccus sp. oral taxon 190 TaxID=1658671 RepID=UPI00067A1926|nr:hypothetical protein [Arsenicicoccus sp. oral taxon 190]AKT51149.1 hypothetical protein ADJ73_07170 [Arsenicicoccus sp. oral taxon 190]
MVVLGLLLVLAALAAGVLAVYGLPTSETQVSWHFLGNALSISPTTIFFIGVASAIALALGLWLMSLGARASARKRRELKELRRDQKEHDRAQRARAAEPARATDRDRTVVRDHDTVAGTDRDGRDLRGTRTDHDGRPGGVGDDTRRDGASSWNDRR